MTSRGFFIPAEYRHVIGEVKNSDFDFIQYNKETDSLLQSDMDVLHKKPKGVIQCGCLTAMKVSFDIDVGNYAIMAIRELMKCNKD